jgi:hypothetical protein
LLLHLESREKLSAKQVQRIERADAQTLPQGEAVVPVATYVLGVSAAPALAAFCAEKHSVVLGRSRLLGLPVHSAFRSCVVDCMLQRAHGILRMFLGQLAHQAFLQGIAVVMAQLPECTRWRDDQQQFDVARRDLVIQPPGGGGEAGFLVVPATLA